MKKKKLEKNDDNKADCICKLPWDWYSLYSALKVIFLYTVLCNCLYIFCINSGSYHICFIIVGHLLLTSQYLLVNPSMVFLPSALSTTLLQNAQLHNSYHLLLCRRIFLPVSFCHASGGRSLEFIHIQFLLVNLQSIPLQYMSPKCPKMGQQNVQTPGTCTRPF